MVIGKKNNVNSVFKWKLIDTYSKILCNSNYKIKESLKNSEPYFFFANNSLSKGKENCAIKNKEWAHEQSCGVHVWREIIYCGNVKNKKEVEIAEWART